MLGDDFYATERERRAAALSALDEACKAEQHGGE
jgi:hypothetical protein